MVRTLLEHLKWVPYKHSTCLKQLPTFQNWPPSDEYRKATVSTYNYKNEKSFLHPSRTVIMSSYWKTYSNYSSLKIKRSGWPGFKLLKQRDVCDMLKFTPCSNRNVAYQSQLLWLAIGWEMAGHYCTLLTTDLMVIFQISTRIYCR